jgi:hypothetical protein
MTDRAFVLQVMPQARYMNLAGHHCIDDDYNGRYLAYGQTSRAAAWREAKRFLQRIAEGKRDQLNHEIYLMVSEAINNHDLDCTCYICTAYEKAENGSEGHAAACRAVADKLYGVKGAEEETR